MISPETPSNYVPKVVRGLSIKFDALGNKYLRSKDAAALLDVTPNALRQPYMTDKKRVVRSPAESGLDTYRDRYYTYESITAEHRHRFPELYANPDPKDVVQFMDWINISDNNSREEKGLYNITDGGKTAQAALKLENITAQYDSGLACISDTFKQLESENARLSEEIKELKGALSQIKIILNPF